MSFNDIVKYLTEQVVQYTNMSSEEKEMRKLEKKSGRQQVAISHEWFGLFPLAFKTFIKRNK